VSTIIAATPLVIKQIGVIGRPVRFLEAGSAVPADSQQAIGQTGGALVAAADRDVRRLLS
jgi:hypothetical protein